MKIGEYELTGRLGAGGMGTVFRAVDAFGKPVALKMIGSPHVINATIFGRRAAPKLPAFDMRHRMMFVREARLAMGLNHPNIARVFDYGQHEGLLFIVMEFLAGRSLDKVVPSRAAIPLATRIRLVCQLCEALDYAHRNGVIHRDVKPPNCFVVQDGRLKVLDFGIATRTDDGPRDIQPQGTPQFMAPEVFSARPQYTEGVDIWAAGVTLYQLLTGRLPFTGFTIGELRKNITSEPFPALDESIPHGEELGRILGRALAKDPAMRYASAADFARDLRSLETPEEEQEAANRQEQAGAEDRWWATAVVRETALTSPLPSELSETISIISGEIRARRGGHAVRYREKTTPMFVWVFLGSIFAASHAISPGWDSDLSGMLGIWPFLAYGSGFLIPLLAATTVILGGLCLWEKAAGIPRCHKCGSIVEHRLRVAVFAYSKISWRHASSDCLAALRENLWDDAGKLLAMHGELRAPRVDEKTAYPPLRLHLDYYACPACSDELAILTTEDRISSKNRLSATWSTREEYEGACKEKNKQVVRLPVRARLKLVVNAIRRAVRMAAEPVHPVLSGIMVVAGFLAAIYYYSQFGIVLGFPGYRASITFQTDPPGQAVKVDSREVPTPYTVSWPYGSDHTIDFDRRVHISGVPYRFERTTIAPPPPRLSAHTGPQSPEDRVLHFRVEELRDEWGRLRSRPGNTMYTVQYTATTDNDQNAMNQREWLQAKERSSAGRSGAAKPLRSFGANPFKVNQPPPAIVVTSDPPGLEVVVDGERITTPKSYKWQEGSYHALLVVSGHQTLKRGGTGSPETYTGGRWDHGISEGSNKVRIDWSAIPFPSRYTARFQRVSRSRDVADGDEISPAAKP